MTNAARALLAPLFFLLLAGAYWKLRILDTASIAFLGLPIGDLFIEHYPMKVYGFTELLRGHPHPRVRRGRALRPQPAGECEARWALWAGQRRSPAY